LNQNQNKEGLEEGLIDDFNLSTSSKAITKFHINRKALKVNKALIRQIRCKLLSNTTDAEKAAAQNCLLLGYRIVRQQPIMTGRRLYFADIYLPEIKTILELDGGYHYTKDQKRKDNNRSSGIWRLGYHVVRLSNHNARDINKLRAKINLIKKKHGLK
jgi:very-short-patch-repair endonuclease